MLVLCTDSVRNHPIAKHSSATRSVLTSPGILFCLAGEVVQL
jgi:hypothetical protein